MDMVSSMLRRWCLLGCLAMCGCALAVVAGEAAPTPDGTYLVWERRPAGPQDLQLPVPTGLTLVSTVYRVRDRKRRDVLRYAFLRLTSPQSVDVLDPWFAARLGSARVSRNAETGAIEYAVGTAANSGLVTLTPTGTCCIVRLERLEQFAIPPRVFDAREQRVQRVFVEIRARYAQATRIRYVAQQQVVDEAGTAAPDAPTLTWTVDFQRPGTLTAEARQGETLGLQIRTEAGTLVTARPGAEEMRAAIHDGITPPMVPALADDPLAALLLGEDAIAQADYFTLQVGAGGARPGEGVLTLTFPERGETHHLFFTLATRLLTRSLVEHREHDARTRMLRVYTLMELSPLPVPITSPVTQPTPQPPAPPAVPDHVD